MPASRTDHAHDPGRLAGEFAELNEYLYVGGQEGDALQRLVDLAVRSVPGCASAAVSSWSAAQRPRILASSDATARIVNEVQHRLGDGPCMTAASTSQIVQMSDLMTDSRWPQFSEMVANGTSVRALLSFHLVREPLASALSLFGDERGAFDGEIFDVAALFAAHARVLLIQAASASRIADLEAALATNRQIGAAVGILMNMHKITEEQAFALLRRSSNQLNRKLREIAHEVNETGALPQRAIASPAVAADGR